LPNRIKEENPLSVPEHEHIVDTGKGKLTLDELAQVQPGLARIMPEVGARIWKCYYAGKARNQPLARFQLKEAVNLMETGVVLRPKYRHTMGAFLETEASRVAKAIESEDWDEFEEAFHVMVARANVLHANYEKPYLVWKIPEFPPPDLDMTAR
jgi:hypothetical protein